jgi:hypothetical protein
MVARVQKVESRRGFASHATGMTASVESLMAWNGPASAKLFAASGSAAAPSISKR